MRVKLFFLIMIFSVGFSFSQLITTVPQYPTENDSITIYLDATQPGAEEILNYNGTLYAHTGVNTNLGNWQHVIGNWGDNQKQPALTRLSANYYKLDIGYPRKFYNLNSSEHINSLAFVFRTSDNTKQTRPDIFVTIYHSGYALALNSPVVSNNYGDPQRSPLFINSNDTINIFAKAVAIGTENSTISILINGVQKLQTNSDSLIYKFIAKDYPGLSNVTIIGKDITNLSDSLKFVFMINPPAENQSLPQGDELGINYNSGTTVTLALFAPQKNFVYVIGDFNDWKVDTSYFMKKDSVKADSVVWWLTINNLNPNQEYAFQYLIDGNLRIADPFSHKVLDPSNDQYISSSIYPGLKPYPGGKTSDIVSVMQTDQNSYSWKISNFKKPDKSNLIIYELLVRDFVSTHWFKTVMDTLNYLKNLGINAIEFMPVMEFEGNDSWGYNSIFHLALDKYYGTRDAFKELVDSAHAKGMAVILDVVLNHAFGENPLVRMYFSSNGTDQILTKPGNPYFNTISPNQTFHWGADFNHAKPATQYYVDRVTSYWIDEFHIDGYRFDFAKGFTNTPGDGGNYDASRISIMQRMAKKIWQIDSTSILILENFVDNNEEKVESNFGFLSWGNMNYNYNEATMGYNQPGHSDLTGAYYANRGWSKPSLVTYMESHDEERLMYKNEQYGNQSPYYKVKNIPTSLKRMGAAAAFYFTIPGPKMIWQFGELGYDYSINYPSLTSADRLTAKPIKWDYFNDPDRQNLYRIFATLIKLRNNYPVFQTSAIMNVSDSLKSIQFSDSSMKVNIIGNFGTYQSNMNPNFQQAGKWYDYFSGDSINVSDQNALLSLNPGEYHIYTTTRLPAPDLQIHADVKNENSSLVTNYKLEQNYPNPFNPSTVIKYQIPEAGIVSIKIFDILGREIETLVNKFQRNGNYEVQFNASNLASGVYFYQLKTNTFISIKKMLLLK
jgi:1,4-alpha-glucan branching enzyme